MLHYVILCFIILYYIIYSFICIFLLVYCRTHIYIHVKRFLTLASAGATIGVMCVFMCCPQMMRKYPENYLLLAVFTVAEALDP